MTAAKRHGIDLLRHRAMQLRKEEELTREIEDQLLAVQTGVEVDLDDHIGDDLLRLVFIACHPLLSPDARAALTLKMLGGLTTDEIARAFLVPEATVAQRIVRAKRTRSEAGVAFEQPARAELRARLASVLAAAYPIFPEGRTSVVSGKSEHIRVDIAGPSIIINKTTRSPIEY